jgi:hypothetical protein
VILTSRAELLALTIKTGDDLMIWERKILIKMYGPTYGKADWKM